MRANLLISPELLIEALHLPAGTKILGPRRMWGIENIELLIDHPDLPPGKDYVSAEMHATYRPPKEGVVIPEGVNNYGMRLVKRDDLYSEDAVNG